MELNEEMVRIARENIKDNGMEDVIHVVHGDAYEHMKTLDEKFELIERDEAKTIVSNEELRKIML